MTFDGVNREILTQYESLLTSRPPKTELPQTIADSGVLTYSFLLDFGSFRDIQRHRAVVQRMPLLTQTHGFEPWYVGAFPEDMREELKTFLETQKHAVEALQTDTYIAQYYIAMGYNISCRLTGDLRALVYLGELRATRLFIQLL